MDFIELRLLEGLPLEQAVVGAGVILLSRLAVPVLYYMANRHARTEPVPSAAPMEPCHDPGNDRRRSVDQYAAIGELL